MLLALATGCASLPAARRHAREFESPATATIPPPDPGGGLAGDLGPARSKPACWGEAWLRRRGGRPAGHRRDPRAGAGHPGAGPAGARARAAWRWASSSTRASTGRPTTSPATRNTWSACSTVPRPTCSTSSNEVEARGLPMEIALLPVIESAFQPYAYSSASASGLWQFIASTGSRFSLKQDWWYDGRRDVVAATRRGAGLPDLPARHVRRRLAAGRRGLQLRRGQCAEGHPPQQGGRQAHRLLEPEAAGRNPRLRAAAAGHRAHRGQARATTGWRSSASRTSRISRQVETGGQISIEVAAELAGITTDEMYDLNPAYHRWATDPSGPYSLLVPVESAEAFRTNLLQLTPGPAPARGALHRARRRHGHQHRRALRHQCPAPAGTELAGQRQQAGRGFRTARALGGDRAAGSGAPGRGARGFAPARRRARRARGAQRRHAVGHRQAPRHERDHAGPHQQHQDHFASCASARSCGSTTVSATAGRHRGHARPAATATTRSPTWSAAATRCRASPRR